MMNSTLLQKALFILYFGEGIGLKNIQELPYVVLDL